MAIDTLAYTKALEAAGVDRLAAGAQAEALVNHVLPDLVTKADLTATKVDLEQAMERLEHRLTVRVFGMVLGIVGVMDSILFALLRVVH
jgi:acid phosphatase family membrane protein YuiD